MASPPIVELCEHLLRLPEEHHFRYTKEASNHLIQLLFYSLCGNQHAYLRLLFPNASNLSRDSRWSLRDAQGAFEGTEYTEAARGHPCGHIFKDGEATYRCRTCGTDDTCVLCAKCYDASDHEGHPVSIYMSHGNSGCCDCGDSEAWQRQLHCDIHSAAPATGSNAAGKARDMSSLPADLVESIQSTIARAMDYLCDVWSCSPEQLRLPKTPQLVEDDERLSRLSPEVYGGPDASLAKTEYALVLWNDEKHTVQDVEDIVARACRIRAAEAKERADEIDAVGRTVVKYSTDLPSLIHAATIIEQPKISVTIRSSRDIFREQMCGTIIEWISDISGCKFGPDMQILRMTICRELLNEWRMGSEAHHKTVGEEGLYDHDIEVVAGDLNDVFGPFPSGFINRIQAAWRPTFSPPSGSPGGPEPPEEEEESDEQTRSNEEDGMDLDDQGTPTRDADVVMDGSDGPEDYLEAQEATMAGYPPPPPPPLFSRQRNTRSLSVSDDEEGSEPLMAVPRTPRPGSSIANRTRPPKYWLEKPEAYNRRVGVPPAEDLWQRVRLDYLILYDLRMWKQLRTDIRDVFIRTVITVPEFKRLMGLRFASVYTVLAELHLIADREPEHSIITLSLQMLTTASITAEIVEKGNFLTNLMAILYTFLTTRQVGYPAEVNLNATLAVDQGVVFNRRAQHFYQDMKYLLQLDSVREQIRMEPRYLLQFLDIAKIHQGICPNIRATGEHLEYEMEAWMSVANVTSEIMKLCRAIAESFVVRTEEDRDNLQRGIRTAAAVAIINSIGSERRRFEQAEIKRPVRFKSLELFEFDEPSKRIYRIVDYNVETEPMSCYHALHYTLSWLIDRCKSIPAEQLQRWLHFTPDDLRHVPMSKRAFLLLLEYQPQENLLAMFDFPIRVCSWIAQMRAGMWIRNGLSLRHQIQQYKGIPRRELTYQRDLFLIQTALVVCEPATILATLIDRFDLAEWVRGNYQPHESREESQTIDMAEDLIHLLIVLLCDRLNLLPDEQASLDGAAVRRDLVHALCFKPLSFTELNKHLTERVQTSEDHLSILHEMTTFKPPEGMTDHGTFTLKEEYIEMVDPYLPYLSRNQREEAENYYRKYMAKKTGKDADEIAFEPKLLAIDSGLFKDLAAFTRTPLFAQMIFYFIQYSMMAPTFASEIAATKIEQFLQFVLHLTLVAVMLDDVDENDMQEDTPHSFCHNALTQKAQRVVSSNTIAALLRRSTELEHLKGCAPKAKLVLRHLHRRRPIDYETWMSSMNLPIEPRTDSPAPSDYAARDLKKQQALERQARVMASFKQQQDNFLQNQTFDWGVEDFSDLEDSDIPVDQEKVWNFPSGSCILCQEKTNTEKLYGTFALISASSVPRSTPYDDDWICEVLETPTSLDRSAESLRPFGVAGKNRRIVRKVHADSKVVELERQDLAKGFPCNSNREVVSIGCGHIMHFSCFEVYMHATQRRHTQQIARHHPENISRNEFLCPLCKALGNVFLPIIWKGKKSTYPGPLSAESTLSHFLDTELIESAAKYPLNEPNNREQPKAQPQLDSMFLEYGESELIPRVASMLRAIPKVELSVSILGPLTRTLEIRHSEYDITIQPNGSILSSPQHDSSSGIPSGTGSISELNKVYLRLWQTLQGNGLVKPSENAPMFQADLNCPESLLSCFGSSIAAVEIAQRGTEVEVGSNLLDKVNSQSLTHLKVLSETITSYLAVGALTNNGDNVMMSGFMRERDIQLQSLFFAHPRLSWVPQSKPFIENDAFLQFAAFTLCSIPRQRLDTKSMIKIFYVAEIVRVVLSYYRLCRSELFEQALANRSDGIEIPNLATFAMQVLGIDVIYPPLLSRLVIAYALPFLRKCTILMHVRYGIDFPSNIPAASDDSDELGRLTQLLQLPDIPMLLTDAMASSTLQDVVNGWVGHYMNFAGMDLRRKQPCPLSLSHPSIYELVGLPKNFDTLQDEVVRRKCPTTGRALSDPTLCLVCGEIFCSQGMCCTKTSKDGTSVGGCWQHRQKCGNLTGLFLHIRKCCILYLHQESGSWTVAPYLDKFGEVDPALRRNLQLFLNQRRYDQILRQAWLNGTVPSMVARKLEGEINPGGWESL